MKTTKRFVALLMAVVMTFALGAVALANGGVFSNLPGTEPVGNFKIPKGLVMKNNTKGNYYRPTVTFTFTIEPSDDAGMTYGAHAAGVKVNKGLAGGLTGIVVDRPSGEYYSQAIPETGKTTLTFYTKEILDVENDPVVKTTEPLQFATYMEPYADVKQPGVYRYKITDVTDPDYLQQLGISRDKDYNPVGYVDLYIQITDDSHGNTTPSVASIVVSQVENNVPKRGENGNIPGSNGTETKDFDPADVYVDEAGNIYTVKDHPTNDPPKYPVDYEDTGYDCETEKGLEKTEDVFNDTPKKEYDDVDGDGIPDGDTTTHVPTNKTGVEPHVDDEGRIVDTDGGTWAQPDYKVDPTTGEILDKDGNSVGEGGTKKYAKYDGQYDYQDIDVYETYNLVLKKDISGPMGDKSHQFPFDVSVTNKTLDTNAQSLHFTYFKKDANGNVVDDSEGSSDAGVVTLKTKLSHGEEFIIRGLNANALINYEETNDTSFPYAVTVAGSAGTNYQNAVKTENRDKVKAFGSTDKNVATATDGVFKQNDVKVITFFNQQSNVNPTGVVLRFAPYILMLGAAFFFVALSRRRREQENA